MADRHAVLAGFVLPLAWDAARAAYVDAAGTAVPEAVLHAALAALIGDSEARLVLLAERLSGGALDALAWRLAMRAELRVTYGVAAALARGGVDQLDGAAWAQLGGTLRRASGYLDQLAHQVTQGDVSPAQLGARAAMYAGGAWGVYQAQRVTSAVLAGHTQARSVLAAGGTHCDGCLTEAGRGWVPLGTLTPIGARDCLSNDRCHIESRAPAAVEA